MKKIFCLLVLVTSNVFGSNTYVSSNLIQTLVPFVDDKIVLYYKDFEINKDSFEWNNEEFSYVVDGNKNVLFFNSDGKPVSLDLSLFELKNYSEKYKDSGSSKSSSQSFVYAKVLNADKYDVLAKPLLFEEKDLFSKLTTVLSNRLDYSVLPDNSEGVTTFQFDIDEHGEIVNAKYTADVDVDGLEYVVKYLYNLEKWAPAQIDGKPVKSTYEVKLYSRYNAEIIHTDKMREKIESLR